MVDSRINFCSYSSSGVCTSSLLFPHTATHRPQSRLNFFGRATLVRIYKYTTHKQSSWDSAGKDDIPVAHGAIDSRFSTSLDSYRLYSSMVLQSFSGSEEGTPSLSVTSSLRFLQHDNFHSNLRNCYNK
jgi:hypothetical protein